MMILKIKYAKNIFLNTQKYLCRFHVVKIFISKIKKAYEGFKNATTYK